MDMKANGEMVNEDHKPSDEEDEILTIMKDGRGEGEPWGYTTPRYLRDQEIGSVDFHLRRLRDAGWIRKVTRGFYRFVEDPRETNTS